MKKKPAPVAVNVPKAAPETKGTRSSAAAQLAAAATAPKTGPGAVPAIVGLFIMAVAVLAVLHARRSALR